MSFVPAPQQANTANNAKSSNAVNSNQPPPLEAEKEDNDLFNLRTFDVYWVEKESLMYKDGISKVSDHSESTWSSYLQECELSMYHLLCMGILETSL